jgi:hypothetical protein
MTDEQHPNQYGRAEPTGRLEYFQPRQAVLHLEHRGRINELQIAGLLQRLNRRLRGARLLPRRTAEQRLLTFESKRMNFTLFPVDVAGLDEDPEKLVRLLIQVQEDIVRDGLTHEGITVRTAAPNWLAGSAPAQIGTGGPGARPTKAKAPASGAPFNRKLARSGGPKLADGRGVVVAILDTAPALHDIVQTYFEWRTCHPGEHPLLESLLAPGGPLTVYPASAADLHRLAAFGLNEHNYLMTDHGLFVAGIIHTLAPRASLHLYEVLNPYGVGDLETIAGGLLRALEPPRPAKLVVNCSLVFNVPTVGQRDPGPLELVREQYKHLLGLWARPIEAMTLWLNGQDVPLVAAAGNDAERNNADPNGARPAARFPAAFDTVIGVGALPREAGTAGFPAASYSNLADRPEKTGYATLGGEEGEEQGIRGLYIGPFPDGRPNDTKWAWWAGTSFATPIVTALVAGVLSAGGSSQLPAVQGALDAIVTNQTPQLEKVLEVVQA